ncbi:MAG: hypothetical protein AAGB26_04065 [Planctomycetota bacterium]
MPRELGKNRPRSTIADMIEFDEIEKEAEEGPVHVLNESKLEKPSAAHLINESTVSTPQRTGEHTNIQKMYRLTPTALQTLRELSSVIGINLGFDVNNSMAIRSILRIIHDSAPTIEVLAKERLTPRRQPSTAIGNEHIRDELESEIAEVILAGILRNAANGMSE